MTRRIGEQVRFPAVCARCAERPALVWQKCTHTKTHWAWALLATHKYTTYTYYLPICEPCRCRDRQADVLSIVIVAALAVLFAVGALLITANTKNRDTPVILLSSGFGGAMVGAAASYVLFGMLGSQKFSSYDGERFTFKNRVYAAQFAVLNPLLIQAEPSLDVSQVPVFSARLALKAFADELATDLQAGKPYAEVEKRARSVRLPAQDLNRVLAALAPYRQ